MMPVPTKTSIVLTFLDFVLIIVYNAMDYLKEQFSKIYDQYIEKIYRFVYLKVNSQEVAEDITSKVFLSSWESYQKNQSTIHNINAFLYQIARNAVTDYYRESGRTKLISTDNIAEFADIGTDLHEKAIIASDIEDMKSAVQKLKKDYQDVIILHYLEDMSIQEVSDILNKPTGTVRVMIHRGLNMLRDELGGEA